MALEQVRNLRRRPDRKLLLAGKITSQDRARLNGYRRQTLMDQALPDNLVRFLEGLG